MKGKMMTSRERLMAALHHKTPDRVPVSIYDMVGWHYDPRETSEAWKQDIDTKISREIFTTYLTGWWCQEPSYQNLMQYIQQKADCVYMTDVPTTNRYVAEHTHMQQTLQGKSTLTTITLETPKGNLVRKFRTDNGIYTAWQTEHQVKDDNDIEKFLSIPFDPMPVDITHVKAQNEYIGENGIILIDLPDPICTVFDLFDFGEFTVRAFTEEKLMLKLLDKVYEEQSYFYEEMLKKGAGPLFRFAGAEACTPPYLGGEQFKKYVADYDGKLIRKIHDHGQLARIHCHGKVKTILNQLLEMEVDALDPLEAPPDGDLQLSEAKQICGNKITIFGNIQLKDLEYLSPAEMKETVKKCLEQGKPGGNFVLLPTATPINVPLSPRTEENIRIMIDAAYEYGQY